MAAKAYRISRIEGLRRSDRRAVVCMACDEDVEIDAESVLQPLAEPKDDRERKRRQHLYSRLELWVDLGKNDNCFHGWPNEPDYKNCIVFKWKEGGQMQRLYGFTCHPLSEDPRFLLCVLVSHRQKNERHTDPKEKVRAERLRVDQAVNAAIAFTLAARKGNNG